MKKIVFDFDGTLLDSRQRMYSLFSNLVPEINLTFDEYWMIKRSGTSHAELINSRIPSVKKFCHESFQNEWMRLIESPNYLDIDQPYPQSGGVLEYLLNNGFILYLCTARQKLHGVNYQLEKFHWLKYFEKVYVTEQKQTKEELLKDNIDWKDTFFVGDTAQDISLAKTFSGSSIAVTYGFRSRRYLDRFTPDFIIEEISQLQNIIKNENTLLEL